MRRAVLVSLLVAACGRSAPPAQTVYVTIGADAVAAARGLTGAHVALAEEADGVAVLALDAADLEPLSELMHERFERCGGFVLHDSLADAHAALHATEPRPAPDYTLDRGELVRAILPELSAARIHATIAELSARKTRFYDSESGAEAARWLAARWRGFGGPPGTSVELVTHVWAQPSVVLTIPGTSRTTEVVVVGGHLDSISLGGARGSAPGADDDASGIATLDEVARAVLASGARPERTLQFIAYSAEEVGLRGSQAIVRDYTKRGVNVVGALQLDMTNYQGSEKDIWLMKDFTSAAQNAFVIQLIEAYVGATWGQDACGYGCSDHASWYRAGVPASMPFEARFRDHNKQIHSAKDTLETSGDNATHALKFARLAAAYAIELGKADPGLL